MTTDAAAATPLPAAPDPGLKLYLIRHGETEWSLAGRHTGRTDIALTAHGEAQARALAGSLLGIAFSHVLTSPRLRARRTAELSGVAPAAVIEPELAEWDYGDHEGQRAAEITKRRPGWNLFRDGCPGGESPDQVSARADRLIGRLAALRGNVVLFSHGHFGRSLAVRWIGLPIIDAQRLLLAPASLSVLGSDPSHPDRRVIAMWNADSAAALRVASPPA